MEMHSFDKNIAKLTNVNCAIILQNIFYWVEKNKANDIHLHEGKYWTYNSMKAFEELFPYLNNRQIRYALQTLEKEGLILTGNFNETCTRTLWYTVTDKALEIITGKPTDISLQPMAEETVSYPDDKIEEELQQVAQEIIEEEKKEAREIEQLEQIIEGNVTKLSNSNDKIVNTDLQNCQYGMTKLSNHTNKKQQITTTNNIEKEIHKEKETTEDPVVSVFDYWNSKNVMKCEELTPSLRNIIKSTLKSNKLDEIKLYISRYDEVLNDPGFYLAHQWSLKSFICQPNAMNEFKDNGEKWINYQSWKSKPKTGPEEFIHNKYTNEIIVGLISNLDEVEV